MAVPQTFNMQNLLDEMQDLQRPVGMANINQIENTGLVFCDQGKRFFFLTS